MRKNSHTWLKLPIGLNNDCNDNSLLLEISKRFHFLENLTFPITGQQSLIVLLFTPSSICQILFNNPWPFIPLFLPWLSTHAFANPLLFLEFPSFNSYWTKCLVRLARHHSCEHHWLLLLTLLHESATSAAIWGPVSPYTPHTPRNIL